jgi:BON domain
MPKRLACAFSTALLALLIGCNKADQQNADQRAAEAKQKARLEAQRMREDARKLGYRAKQEAGSLRQNIDRALQGTGPAQGGGTGQAEEKLRRGGADLRVAGNQAAVKLDHAAMIAKVKAKLATDVGLSTVTGVDVDARGQVVTLRGTVASEQQKQEAEQAVLRLSGVTRVVNELTVKP